MSAIEMFLFGSGGAVAAELLKLYDYRSKLSTKKFQAMAHSRLFWAIVVGMILASGFVAVVVNTGTQATLLQVVLTGMGARGIARGAGEAGTAMSHKMTLGDSVTIRDVFA